MKRSTVLASIAVLLAAATQGLEISLTVEEPAGVARISEPVSGGVPLPWGQFKKDQSFALFEGSTEIPVQVLPLVVDEKGFLRWVLLDFQTTLAAREKKTFVLKTTQGQAVHPSPLKVTQRAGSVVVDTGKISFTVDGAAPFGLFSSVALSSAQGAPSKILVRGGEVTYTDAFDGKTYKADKPSQIEVEYAGPLRTTIAVKGRFVGDEQSKLQYVARITAWAGRSDVHVKYSLCNSNPDHYTYRKIKDSTIALVLATEPERVKIGAYEPLEARGEVWMQQSMRVFPAAIHSHDVLAACNWLRATPGATEPGACKVVSTHQELWTSQSKGDVAEGWLAPDCGNLLWACDLYFTDDPPRRLPVQGDKLSLTGVTVPLEDITKMPFPEKERCLFDCSHLSSQYMLDSAAPSEAKELSAKTRRARARLWLMTPPE
ncbi:MAG: exo-rhamnogalacturonan lyase family protein [Kiritimatiellia bacterium]